MTPLDPYRRVAHAAIPPYDRISRVRNLYIFADSSWTGILRTVPGSTPHDERMDFTTLEFGFIDGFLPLIAGSAFSIARGMTYV